MATSAESQASAAAAVPDTPTPRSDDGDDEQQSGAMPPLPQQSSSKRRAHFGAAGGEDEGEPPVPMLGARGSSFVHAVSELRTVFSESVLDVAPPQMFCYVLAACACLNSCNLGYDVGSVGGAALLMREEFGWSSWELGFYVGSINFFCIPGALGAGYICDRFGRRFTFTFSCFVFIAGLLIQVCGTGGPHSFAIAMAGRVFVGIGVGLGLSIDPLYISEVSPPSHRGHLVSFSEIAINFGIMLGFIADYAFLGLSPGLAWRLMLGLGIVMPCILIILTVTVMPESPRWLLMQGRHDEATAVLKRTYPVTTNFDRMAEEIQSTIEADFEADHGTTWHAILRPSPVVARMLLAGVGLAACQQFNGAESLVYFSPEILRHAGIVSRTASFGMTILIGMCKMLFTLVAVFYVDQAGRRPLLLLSTGGLCLCLVLMAAVSNFEKLSSVMVFAMCLYMSCFSVGIGPLTWVGATEVFSTRIRAKAMSLAVSTNRLISGVIASLTLPLLHALTPPGYFILYAVLTFVSMIYMYMFFPETKGKTLEEVEHHFEEIVASKARGRAAKEAAAEAAAAENGATKGEAGGEGEEVEESRR